MSHVSLKKIALYQLGLKRLYNDRLLDSLDRRWFRDNAITFSDKITVADIIQRIDMLLFDADWRSRYRVSNTIYPVKGVMFGRENCFKWFSLALEEDVGCTRVDWMCLSTHTVTLDVLKNIIAIKGIDTPLLFLTSVTKVSQECFDALCEAALYMESKKFQKEFLDRFISSSHVNWSSDMLQCRMFARHLSVRHFLSLLENGWHVRGSDYSKSIQNLRKVILDFGLS